MRKAATILLLLVVNGLNAQSPSLNNKEERVSTNGIFNPAVLSQIITASCKTEEEKVKAIFYWITDNIEYFRYKPHTSLKKGNATATVMQDDNAPLPSLNERVAIKVLKDRMSVCDGYARLFKSLCEHAGIRAEIITGYARTNWNKSVARFVSNHTWNAVFFNNKWHLLDATWASGYMAGLTGEFVKQFDANYFLADPAVFINDHYPDDMSWSLLEETPAIGEFSFHPFRQRSFVKYQISSYFPLKGVIDANLGDTVRLGLETKFLHDFISIAPDSLWEQNTLFEQPVFAYVKPELPLSGGKVYYNFPVQSASVQWLYVMYNNDAVLRYRLNVKSKKE